MIRQFASLVAILSVLLGGVAGCGSQSGPANSTQAQTSGGGEEKTKMEEVDDPTLLPQFKGVLKFDSATADRPEVKHRADSYQRFFSAPLSLVLDFSSNLVKITFTGLPVSAAESCVADVVYKVTRFKTHCGCKKIKLVWVRDSNQNRTLSDACFHLLPKSDAFKFGSPPELNEALAKQFEQTFLSVYDLTLTDEAGDVQLTLTE